MLNRLGPQKWKWNGNINMSGRTLFPSSVVSFLAIWGSLAVLLRRRQWQPTPVLLPGKSHGRRSLVGCSPWGRWGSNMTERLHFHFSLSCTGEGNGNPLQCSCLENPRDSEAWWAAVYGVAQSRTRLKRLSSSSSSRWFSGTLLLFPWSSGCWQFDLWFLCLFAIMYQY